LSNVAGAQEQALAIFCEVCLLRIIFATVPVNYFQCFFVSEVGSRPSLPSTAAKFLTNRRVNQSLGFFGGLVAEGAGLVDLGGEFFDSCDDSALFGEGW
jgi:hypothetical protein